MLSANKIFAMFKKRTRQRGWEWDSVEMNFLVMLGKCACFVMEEK
jgi:hypothetical protein